MTWFSLPAMRSDRPPAFADMDGANAWLATQPLANAPLMQDLLAEQIDSLNTWAVPPRERFKILETLRNSVFAIDSESAKRYEYRPLPLAPTEQRACTASCRIWRGLAAGYLHCLKACLDGDTVLGGHCAKIAHRTLTSLRLEQLARYRGGSAVPGNWWRLLHAVLASAEQLGVATTPVSDRLFAETAESTPAGQYAMAVLLHLSRPHELSRSQFAAAQRWLARWREQATLHATADAAAASRSLAIDLGSDAPVHTGAAAPAIGRWLAIDAVLGKCKSRIKSLREGQTPEELKLGSGLTAEACIGLLQFLHGALQAPPAPFPATRDGKRTLGVCSTLAGIHRLLGGKLADSVDEPTSHSNRRVHEQIAIFGRAVRDERELPEQRLENWQLIAEANAEMVLVRAAGSDGERLANRSLIVVSDPVAGLPSLAIVRCLAVLDDGALCATARLLPSAPQALVLNGREKVSNRSVQQPAIFLPAAAPTGQPPSVFVPAGVLAKLARFEVSDLPVGLTFGETIDRGANFERLHCG